MNKINTQHALQYFHYRLAKTNLEFLEEQRLYEIARTKYENGLWWKLFKTPFENTSAGDLSWMNSNNWTHDWSIDNIKTFKNCINTCNYHNKIGDNFIVWNFYECNIKHFYAWASDNKIPF